jgi:hypothetical protein
MEEAGRELVWCMWVGGRELLWICDVVVGKGVEAWPSWEDAVVPRVRPPPRREGQRPCGTVRGGQRPPHARVRLPGLCGAAWPCFLVKASVEESCYCSLYR